jgi:hypothetical protein
LKALADPKRHPFGNWLRIICKHAKTPSLEILAHRSSNEISAQTLRKWASGARRLPLKDGFDLVKTFVRGSVAEQDHIQGALTAAQILALALDFMRSTTKHDPPNEKALRVIVSERIRSLNAAILRTRHVGALRDQRRAAQLAGSSFETTTPENCCYPNLRVPLHPG